MHRFAKSFLVFVFFNNGSVVQLVRMLACHARGRGFKSHPNRQYSLIVQLVERWTVNPYVVGSSPTQGALFNNINLYVVNNISNRF